MVSHSMSLLLPLTASSPSLTLAVPWQLSRMIPRLTVWPVVLKDIYVHCHSEKRELFLRLLRHKTYIVSHFDPGEHQKVGAWKVVWVPSKKENFLVQKGLGLVQDCQEWGSWVWTYHSHLALKGTEFPVSSTLECPCKSDSGQTDSKLMMDS